MLPRFFRKTPLAILQLMKQKTRLSVALAGIAFADILMFLQMGLLDSLYDSSTYPIELLEADLVLLNAQSETLIDLPSFPRKRLYQALGYEGVASASPIHLKIASWRNPETLVVRSTLAWGIDPSQPTFSFLTSAQKVQLKLLNRGLFDEGSHPKFGPVSQLIQQHDKIETEVNEKTFQAVGVFRIGSSFGVESNIITSIPTFLNLVGDESPSQINLGLIQLEPNADLRAAQNRLQTGLPEGIKVLTKAEFVQLEKSYWAAVGTGFIFNMGTAVGFIVGTVIVYQILYTDVSDHLPEYATLKAMGYSDSYLIGVLVQEVLILATLGFIPGFICSLGLYQITYAATLLPVVMKVTRAVTVFGLTLVMCSASGAIALQKLRSADPADIFG